MRLIDSDEFKKQIARMSIANNYPTDKANKMCKLIDYQKTVYDVDKVVERLEEELNLADNEKERCSRENQLQFDTAKGYSHSISVSLEIVKSGGID